MDMKSTMNKAMQTMFRPIDNVSYDLASGTSGIKTNAGLVTLGKDDVLDQNPLDFFSMEIPAFAMLTPATEVKRGDILVSDGRAYGFLLEDGDKKSVSDEEAAKASIQTINVQGHISRFRPKRVSMLGVKDGLTVVRSFGSMFGGEGNTGTMDMNSLLPLMLMSGDKDMSSMLPLLMMSQGGAGGLFSNPMMLMMLMGDGGFKNPFK